MSSGTARERALLIDDADDLRMLLRLLLEASGRYEVVAEARDGHSGVEEAARTEPDLVLLDLSMPTMGGLEALPHLRRAAPHARVVVLSGFAEDDTAHAAVEAGAAGFVEKSADPQTLLARIDEVVGRG